MLVCFSLRVAHCGVLRSACCALCIGLRVGACAFVCVCAYVGVCASAWRAFFGCVLGLCIVELFLACIVCVVYVVCVVCFCMHFFLQNVLTLALTIACGGGRSSRILWWSPLGRRNPNPSLWSRSNLSLFSMVFSKVKIRALKVTDVRVGKKVCFGEILGVG